MTWPSHDGANGLFEKRKLMSCATGHINSMNLADLRKSGADVQALSVFGPVERAGGSNVLKSIQIADYGLRYRWYIFHQDPAMGFPEPG